MERLVRSAIAAMMPGNDKLPSARDVRLREFIPRFREETSPVMWVGVVGASVAYQALPFATVKIPLPASLLPAGLREKHTQRMADHSLYPIRQASFLLKMVMGLHWAAQPEVREKFGLEPYPEDPDHWRTS